jgi:hypothetical protein
MTDKIMTDEKKKKKKHIFQSLGWRNEEQNAAREELNIFRNKKTQIIFSPWSNQIWWLRKTLFFFLPCDKKVASR